MITSIVQRPFVSWATLNRKSLILRLESYSLYVGHRHIGYKVLEPVYKISKGAFFVVPQKEIQKQESISIVLTHRCTIY